MPIIYHSHNNETKFLIGIQKRRPFTPIWGASSQNGLILTEKDAVKIVLTLSNQKDSVGNYGIFFDEVS